ncbi:MAG: NAD(P)/FAD-dependent oxidoreductase [Desulfobulbaceae bacterium]
MEPSRTVLIIGGGPSGLTAAYQCGKKKLAAVCFEADTILGGISRTVEYRGFRFDVGGHRFFTKIQAVNEIWQEVLGNEFLTRPRLSRIFYNGRFFFYPLQPWNALAGLGLINSLRILGSYVKARLFPARPEDNFERWVSNRFGHYLYRIFFKTYTEKVWGIPCDQIQAEWAAQRIKGLSLWSAVMNSLHKPKKVIKSLISEFRYPRLGPGQMYETMARKAEELGSEIRLNSRVHRIHHANRRITAVTVLASAEGGQQEYRMEGSDVISSMPLTELVLRLDPPPPPEVMAAARSLRFRGLLTVNLLIDQPQQLPDTWLYIHDPSVNVGRIQFFANWSPFMVPGPDKSSMGMEYFCWEDDRLWSMDDGDLIRLAKEEISRLGLIDPAKVFDGFVIRMAKSYPVYDSEYRRHVAVLKNYLDRFANLQLCGRYGLFKYNNMDHSILTAMYAVENILGASHDVWSINADDEYHEEAKQAT